ncbi:hypothetical protein BXZ70DRAFT_757514 [Cristinia sonorae]|uniref:Uncharacterized protein n=1 Tax=Cristinia sonorae TaxID=1940300 RepID=A0A8K0XRS8_9AGAR|nr:hypothetical protein BXZ70DRAFT_757514 [Cristinia sonorae]
MCSSMRSLVGFVHFETDFDRSITDAFTTPVLSATAVRIYPRAAALAWAETQLNMTYSFEVANGPHYIVPTPVNLPRDVHASWLSDVAVMQPQCEWVDPEQKTYSTATGLSGTINVISPKHKLNITVQPATDLPSVGATVSVKATIYYDIHDLPENQVTVSGVMVWLVARCSQDCPEVIGLDLDFDLSGIPQIQVPIKEFNDSAPPNLYQVAFLVCSPNAEVTTREVRNDGRGRLTVSDLDFPSQGNLLPSQTNVLFSNALSTVSFTGGELPNNLQPSLGTETQAALFFGLDTTNLNTSTSIPPLKPLPLENITAGYARLLHSASKAFLGGGLSKANVPGCLATERVVFTSSLPQAIVSTVLFLLLWAIAAASYLRSESPQFSLFSVAASLNGSDIPQVMGHIRSAAMPDMNEKDMVAKLGARAVVATSRENGPVLLLQ